MASISDNTFGARLRRAQDIVSFFPGFPNYNPPRLEENVENFTALVTSISEANFNVSNLKETYRVLVEKRRAAYRKNPDSLEKILVPVRAAVEARFGRRSAEARSVGSFISKMRSVKLSKDPVDPTNPDADKAHSTAQLSYGSMIQIFNDVIAALVSFNGYDPSNEKIKIAALKERSARMNAMNNDLAVLVQQVKEKANARLLLFDDLRDRVLRIKSYVKSEYGIHSNQYKLIKGLKF